MEKPKLQTPQPGIKLNALKDVIFTRPGPEIGPYAVLKINEIYLV